ncbi:amino acid aminotransferase [Parvularcula maris]|uniref:Aromatic amino acid transaminase n=1 Tax=Parvularcula maris TaxID=2965077 RepID=A0A9X2LA84_9PROT|nr:aromatic amino acid transaminase [Parvularcula maris]MCQ8185990.1 aromatic amino acid transaminase [Parvularcula maris]
MDSLNPAPADPLLGLMLAARADERPGKTDLGVGIYKTEAGDTPVLRAVKEAERRLLETETTKAYEGPHGNPLFCEAIGELTLGGLGDRHTAFTTPGGCGALFIGMQAAKLASPDARLFLSDPSWPNHEGIAAALGIETVFYPYVGDRTGAPDMDLVLKGLEGARAGDILLLQGACHNPTGTDFSAEQWVRLAEEVEKRGLLPFVDTAYQGFARGLEEDGANVKAFLERIPEAILTYSCSKNFGLYRERTGALIIQAPGAKAKDAVATQTAALVRASYSMPPSHGAAIVATILNDAELRRSWEEELGQMRGRLNGLREGFASALVRATNDDSLSRIAEEKGMFSQLPIEAEDTLVLQREKGIYMPGSGRVNIAGLKEDRLGELAADLASYLVR